MAGLAGPAELSAGAGAGVRCCELDCTFAGVPSAAASCSQRVMASGSNPGCHWAAQAAAQFSGKILFDTGANYPSSSRGPLVQYPVIICFTGASYQAPSHIMAPGAISCNNYASWKLLLLPWPLVQYAVTYLHLCPDPSPLCSTL